jgi:hypothetical protein
LLDVQTNLISFPAVALRAAEDGFACVELASGRRLRARSEVRAADLAGRVELSPHPLGGWRFRADR